MTRRQTLILLFAVQSIEFHHNKTKVNKIATSFGETFFIAWRFTDKLTHLFQNLESGTYFFYSELVRNSITSLCFFTLQNKTQSNFFAKSDDLAEGMDYKLD